MWAANLVTIPTIGDGSCFFHALLTCVDSTYNTSSTKKKVLKCNALRLALSEALTLKLFLEPGLSGIPLYQDLPLAVDQYKQDTFDLSSSDISKYEAEIKTLPILRTLSNLREVFIDFLAFKQYIAQPGQVVGDELHPLVSNELQHDIYFVTGLTNPGYTLNNPDTWVKGRMALILCSQNSHWEPVGQIDNGVTYLYFKPDSDIISILYKHNKANWQALQ